MTIPAAQAAGKLWRTGHCLSSALPQRQRPVPRLTNDETNEKIGFGGYDFLFPVFSIVADTKGTLLWKSDDQYEKPHIILMSEQIDTEYLSYLDGKNISYVVTRENHIDLVRVAGILKETFGIECPGIVGGPAINTAFLDAGLLDEVIVLIEVGIDGRSTFPPVFNRNDNGKKEPTPLELVDVKKYSSGAVFIRYKTK